MFINVYVFVDKVTKYEVRRESRLKYKCKYKLWMRTGNKVTGEGEEDTGAEYDKMWEWRSMENVLKLILIRCL